MRTPSWDEFREFIKRDDWEEDRATGHDLFEKTLPDGEILRTKTPASRPSPAPEPAPRSLPLWLALALEREVGLTREQIAELDEDQARRLLDEARSQPRD